MPLSFYRFPLNVPRLFLTFKEINRIEKLFIVPQENIDGFVAQLPYGYR